MSEHNLRPVVLSLAATALLFGLGCLLPQAKDEGGGDGGDKDGPGPGGEDYDSRPRPDERAWFILSGTDLRSPEWPEDWAEYDILVCNPALTDQDVAQIRGALPNATLLAYTNVQDIRWGMHPESSYYQTLTASFDSTWCLREIPSGRILRVQGYESGNGIPAWIVRQPSADALVDFHRDVTMLRDWDGFYIDQCTTEYPPWRIDIILDQTGAFDVDGDGRSDRMSDLIDTYETWRPYFTSRMREVLGDEAILVANAGGPLVDGALNGITLEGVGDRFAAADARIMILDAADVARSPWMAAVWVTTEGSWEASRLIAEGIAGVHFGEVDYFPAE